LYKKYIAPDVTNPETKGRKKPTTNCSGLLMNRERISAPAQIPTRIGEEFSVFFLFLVGGIISARLLL